MQGGLQATCRIGVQTDSSIPPYARKNHKQVYKLGPHAHSDLNTVATHEKLLLSPCGLRGVSPTFYVRKSSQQTTVVFHSNKWRMLYMLNKNLSLKAGG